MRSRPAADQRKIFHIPADAMDADQPTRIMRDSLRGRRLSVIDALPALRAAQGKGAPLYGKIDSHLSARGHEVVARLIAPVVIDYLEQAAARGKRPTRPCAKNCGKTGT